MTRSIAGLFALSLLAAPKVAPAAAFQNGSFELGSPGPGACYAIIPSGDARIAGWTVIRGDVDWYGPSCTILPSNGANSLDLVGDQTVGGVQQTFDTVPGTTYTVTFDLNGNYGALPTIKPLTVTVDADVHDFTFDTTGETQANFASRYVTESFTFVAASTSATISFVSDTTGQGFNAGAVIDNVRVTGGGAAIPVPALSPTAMLALACLLAAAALIFLRRVF